jgi:2'-5' RNA ligase
MSADASLRLFVAIELPEDVRNMLGAAAAALERAAPPRTLRLVRPEGIHLTLKFLGATPPSRVPAIVDALAPVVASRAPLSLRLGDVGSFGGRRNVRVAWIRVEGDTAPLAALAAAIDGALAQLGSAIERRPFAAHLTLARVRDEASAAQREAISSAIAALPAVEPRAIAVTHIALMRSRLGAGGARYGALARLTLGGASAPILPA